MAAPEGVDGDPATMDFHSMFAATKYVNAARRVQLALKRVRGARLVRQWFRIIERAKQQVHLRNKAAKTRSKLAFVKATMKDAPAETDAEEAARMFQMSANLLNTLVSMQDDGEVQLTVANSDEADHLDITKQGNADHYTSTAVRDRKRLSYDIKIRAVTHVFWLMAVGENRDAEYIDYDAYCRVFARITKALVPDFDRAAAENLLATDWEADNGGFPAPAGQMSKEQMHVALFELVDTWVDVVDCESYMKWLYALLWSISRVEDAPLFGHDGQVVLQEFDDIYYMLNEDGVPDEDRINGDSYEAFKMLCLHVVKSKIVRTPKMPAELRLEGEVSDSDDDDAARKSGNRWSTQKSQNHGKQSKGSSQKSDGVHRTGSGNSRSAHREGAASSRGGEQARNVGSSSGKNRNNKQGQSRKGTAGSHRESGSAGRDGKRTRKRNGRDGTPSSQGLNQSIDQEVLFLDVDAANEAVGKGRRQHAGVSLRRNVDGTFVRDAHGNALDANGRPVGDGDPMSLASGRPVNAGFASSDHGHHNDEGLRSHRMRGDSQDAGFTDSGTPRSLNSSRSTQSRRDPSSFYSPRPSARQARLSRSGASTHRSRWDIEAEQRAAEEEEAKRQFQIALQAQRELAARLERERAERDRLAKEHRMRFFKAKLKAAMRITHGAEHGHSTHNHGYSRTEAHFDGRHFHTNNDQGRSGDEPTSLRNETVQSPFDDTLVKARPYTACNHHPTRIRRLSARPGSAKPLPFLSRNDVADSEQGSLAALASPTRSSNHSSKLINRTASASANRSTVQPLNLLQARRRSVPSDASPRGAQLSPPSVAHSHEVASSALDVPATSDQREHPKQRNPRHSATRFRVRKYNSERDTRRRRPSAQVRHVQSPRTSTSSSRLGNSQHGPALDDFLMEPRVRSGSMTRTSSRVTSPRGRVSLTGFVGRSKPSTSPQGSASLARNGNTANSSRHDKLSHEILAEHEAILAAIDGHEQHANSRQFNTQVATSTSALIPRGRIDLALPTLHR